MSYGLQYQSLLIGQQKFLENFFFLQNTHIFGQLALEVHVGGITRSKTKLFFKKYFIFGKINIKSVIHYTF